MDGFSAGFAVNDRVHFRSPSKRAGIVYCDRGYHGLTMGALPGGFLSAGAVALRKNVFDAVFSSMVGAPVHRSTLSKNNLAMAAGLATRRVIREEDLVGNAARLGEAIHDRFRAMTEKFEFLHSVREVVAATHEVPGSVWDLGKTLASQALRNRAGRT